MGSVKIFKTEPIFSLDPVRHLLRLNLNSISPGREQYVIECVQKLLASVKGNPIYHARDLCLIQLPLQHRRDIVYANKKVLTIETLEVLAQRCAEDGVIALSLPYLLGLAHTYAAQAYQELMHGARFIETLSFPDTFSFTYRGFTQEHQLCLKQEKQQLIIAVSEFISGGVINQSQRISKESVRIIAEAPATSSLNLAQYEAMIGS